MYYFVVNTSSRSGKGYKVWQKVKAELENRNIEYKAYRTKTDYSATTIAKKICGLDETDKHIVVLGGDGTINEVVNGISDFSKVSLSVIPVGSGNDFARGLGINNNDSVELLEKILECKEEYLIDIGQVKSESGSRYFVISSGFGLDAYVCKKVQNSKLKKILNWLHLGNLTYILLTVISLVSLKKVNAKVKADSSETDMPEMIFSALMNMSSEGGGVKMAPKARDNDGYLTMVSANKIAKWKTFFYLPLLAIGKHEKIKGFISVNCKNAVITSEDEMVLHCDGEYIGDVKWAEFNCIENILKIRM